VNVKLTTLPSNLRPTTRECVQLYLVSVLTSGHVTNMVVTSFDPSWRKTPCYTQTSWFYVL